VISYSPFALQHSPLSILDVADNPLEELRKRAIGETRTLIVNLSCLKTEEVPRPEEYHVL